MFRRTHFQCFLMGGIRYEHMQKQKDQLLSEMMCGLELMQR